MRQGILVMAYGTPERLEDVEAYYTHIRRGSRPPADLLDDLVARYVAVGGPTELNRITRAQASLLREALATDGLPLPVHVAFKHVAPFIGDEVARMADEGVERAVGLVLAPHYSLRSIAEYVAYAEARRPPGLELDVIPTWHDDPAFVAFLADRLSEALAREAAAAAGEPRGGAGSAGRPPPHVLFTAHSIPAAAAARGDPYPDELRRTCELVRARAGAGRWSFAYQSAGRTEEPWLGPDVLEAIDAIAAGGASAVVVQPIGFVADHLEVLYDLDVEARRAAEARGLRYARVEMPNLDPRFIAALAGIVRSRLDEAPSASSPDRASGR